MYSRVIVAALTSVLLTSHLALAADTGTATTSGGSGPPLSTISTGAGRYFCIYLDRAYSAGARACIANGWGAECKEGGDNTKAAHWLEPSKLEACQPAEPDSLVSANFKLPAVNFNPGAATDNALAIKLPTGIARYLVSSVRINNASGSISTATLGVFTAAGGSGQTIAGIQPVTVTASNVDSNNNAQSLNLTNATTEAYNDTTIQVRIVTSAGSPATADVIVTILPLR